ncbi:hypothetical protein TSOC_007519 [Tetrabaena socialis]|uniref:Protein kinase domain-containing protein n=1 Tax=Tetrabaena socialis TaxID=47790 RepID=A0A2J8A0V7_9CHLO|nr:hypothetical protein TSOC_007519 [Tetrabaena socialis]|eukprot:PNH06144.1 hypothetical protein TSOC_007519 [Tetrabaena socialis]
MTDQSPSELASRTTWQKHTYNPTSSPTSLERLEEAAFFGFRPRALLPAVIPAKLVAAELGLITQAAMEAALPPPDLCFERHGELFASVQRLLTLASALYPDEKELQNAFLRWHNTELGVGDMIKSEQQPKDEPGVNWTKNDGMLTAFRKYVVTLLECKSDTGGGEPLVQALCYYQQHYQNGEAWRRSLLHQADPLPSLVLLLEGPRLSIHAVWTLYQNRIGYTPLTPSYYLANEPGATANLWKLVAVLGAYQQAVCELTQRYTALERSSMQLCQRKAALRQAACLKRVGRAQVERPCTLPYCLLEEALGLEDVRFMGPRLLYTAMQKLQGGAAKRAVLVKLVEGSYGSQVHDAWHSVGAAPALYSATPVARGGSMVMVIMEHLRTEEGWMVLSEGLREAWGQQLPAAVKEALRSAHAVQLPCGSTAAHADMRSPNILVRMRTDEGGAGMPEVRFIDFDWWVFGMLVLLQIEGREWMLAGPAGTTCYPLLLLSPDVSWHPEAHDWHLLERDLS